MAALPFSDQQRAALLALRGGAHKTTEVLRGELGLGPGLVPMLSVLYARGLVRYKGGSGGRNVWGGDWFLTKLGETTAQQLAAGAG